MSLDLLKISANTIAQIISRATSTASTLIITLLITHTLTKADLGIFITITSYVALFYVIADFGLNGVLIREAAGDERKISDYFASLVSLRLILSIITVFIALSVLGFTHHSAFIKLGIIISTVSIVTTSVFNTSLAIFQAKLRYDQAAIADILGSIMTLASAYLFIISHFSIIFVVVAYLLGGATRALVSLFLVGSQTTGTFVKFNTNLWGQMLLIALPIGATLIFSEFVANIDKQIVYLANYQAKLHLNNEVAAGVYGLAYNVFGFGIILPAFFVNSVYPLLIRDKNENLPLLRNNFFKYSKMLAFAGVLITVLVLILSPQIIGLFGSYNQSIGTLRILSLGYVFFYITPLLMWTVISLNKEKLLPFVYGFAAVFNLATNIYFVPRFGFNSAAVITVITEALIFVLLFVIMTPFFKFKGEENASS